MIISFSRCVKFSAIYFIEFVFCAFACTCYPSFMAMVFRFDLLMVS
jgi:hypothetical protein